MADSFRDDRDEMNLEVVKRVTNEPVRIQLVSTYKGVLHKPVKETCKSEGHRTEGGRYRNRLSFSNCNPQTSNVQHSADV